MATLSADRFPGFFEAVRKREPFPWQAEFAARLLEGDPPDVIDVPTGFGKTSVIDCWAYALAAQASTGDRSVPLRLCFVVDRRLVVDSAYDHADSLRHALREAASEGVVAEVAGALRSLHGEAAPALEVVRMRGGLTWESRWLARPDQAAVIVGTVDQFGSRVLFRGYGVSASMRPIDAALVGTDSWLVVDEAHIAEPLTRTVARVGAHQARSELTSTRGLRMTRMSATVDGGEDVFRPDVDTRTDAPRFPSAAAAAAKRLNARKPVVLIDLPPTTVAPSKRWSDQAQRLGRAMATIASYADADASVVGVVVNTVVAARAAHRELTSSGEKAILLIGRVRGFERDRIIREWIPRIRVGAKRDLDRRLFVVATQTIEVGADLDLDVLVTECAPLSALIQRFGRANRTGDRAERRSAIVHASVVHDHDAVYGEATDSTWRYLRSLGDVATLSKKDIAAGWPEASIDLGLRSARGLLQDAPAETHPPAPFVPIALGAHMERWAATNPSPFPDQPVAPFLHGVDRDTPEVGIAWRAAPPAAGDDPSVWQHWLDLVPPVDWEFVSVPIWDARSLLVGDPPASPMADVEGVRQAIPSEPPTQPATDVIGVVYRGRAEPASVVRGPGDIAPGDRVVLRSDVGGHDEWAWTGERRSANEPPVTDVGDVAPTRHRSTLRLAANVFETWMPGIEGVSEALGGLDRDDPGSVAAALTAVAALGLPDELDALVSRAHNWRTYPIETAGAAAFLLSEASAGRDADAISDDDEASTSQVVTSLSLRAHGGEVAATAKTVAQHLGLPDQIVRAVELAGMWHDLGKADPRFQVMLHDGDELAALAALEPLAKSGRDPRDPVARVARRLAGVPRGFRHEAVSARAFDAIVAIKPEHLDGVDSELVRHLIVSHHGKARPLLPAIFDRTAPEVHIRLNGSDVTLQGGAQSQVDWGEPRRFEALNERYGWWGLALLESIVRLADMWCSERAR